jgi:hypothetical protein
MLDSTTIEGTIDASGLSGADSTASAICPQKQRMFKPPRPI